MPRFLTSGLSRAMTRHRAPCGSKLAIERWRPRAQEGRRADHDVAYVRRAEGSSRGLGGGAAGYSTIGGMSAGTDRDIRRDETPVTFRWPLKEQEFRLCHTVAGRKSEN